MAFHPVLEIQCRQLSPVAIQAQVTPVLKARFGTRWITGNRNRLFVDGERLYSLAQADEIKQSKSLSVLWNIEQRDGSQMNCIIYVSRGTERLFYSFDAIIRWAERIWPNVPIEYQHLVVERDAKGLISA